MSRYCPTTVKTAEKKREEIDDDEPTFLSGTFFSSALLRLLAMTISPAMIDHAATPSRAASEEPRPQRIIFHGQKLKRKDPDCGCFPASRPPAPSLNSEQRVELSTRRWICLNDSLVGAVGERCCDMLPHPDTHRFHRSVFLKAFLPRAPWRSVDSGKYGAHLLTLAFTYYVIPSISEPRMKSVRVFQ